MTEPAATKLLSGGNPQIAKGDGDAPVQAYLDAVPDWKNALCREIDRLVVAAVPDVRKAVKWNSPFYGAADGDGWFLSFHCMTKYVKVAFFRGASLEPLPPGTSKQADVRYLDIGENWREDGFDAGQFSDWVRQAAGLPGVKM